MINLMLEKYKKMVKELVSEPIHLKKYEYLGKERNHENAIDRHRVLVGFLHSEELREEQLLIKLFEAEIASRREDDFQGFTEALDLAAYLVSLYQCPDYISLFIQAKNANFDTHCGFDREYLLHNGVKNTFEWISHQEVSWKEDFYDLIGDSLAECDWDEEDIVEWKERKKRYYSLCPEEMSTEGIVYYALDLEEDEIAKECIQSWEENITVWNKERWEDYVSFYKGIGNIDKVIVGREALWEYVEDDAWGKASFLSKLIEDYLSIKEYVKVWLKLKEGILYLEEVEECYEINLGRYYVIYACNLLIGISNKEDMMFKDIYPWIKTTLNKIKVYPYLLEKAIQVFVLSGDKELENKYILELELLQKE
ncbi:hypothetical protein [Myroides odoratimimus]|uniref:hypothetical protein n=1 Tax=Myroides odoratimimus TaxID=76832 RepID=UPI0029C0600D|nr:hypothetical protein [Myroides odoratimimus]MDX4974022.1 hypothetical protein [Myroides odoratimimus]